MYRDARVQRIYGGTNEIMKVLIATDALVGKEQAMDVAKHAGAIGSATARAGPRRRGALHS